MTQANAGWAEHTKVHDTAMSVARLRELDIQRKSASARHSNVKLGGSTCSPACDTTFHLSTLNPKPYTSVQRTRSAGFDSAVARSCSTPSGWAIAPSNQSRPPDGDTRPSSRSTLPTDLHCQTWRVCSNVGHGFGGLAAAATEPNPALCNRCSTGAAGGTTGTACCCQSVDQGAVNG